MGEERSWKATSFPSALHYDAIKYFMLSIVPTNKSRTNLFVKVSLTDMADDLASYLFSHNWRGLVLREVWEENGSHPRSHVGSVLMLRDREEMTVLEMRGRKMLSSGLSHGGES